MKKIIYALILLPIFTNAQHVSKVYFNIVNEDRCWFSESKEVDFYIELKFIDFNMEVVTNGDYESSYVLTDTISSKNSFTKWKAYDWKGDDCEVSIGQDLEGEKYIIIQYQDMGWCCVFDKFLKND